MTVTIKSNFIRTLPSDGVYRVAVEVTETTGIGPNVFVFNVEDDTYSHVATVYDMESFPDSKSEAETLELAFYRASSVIKDYEDAALVVYFEDVTKNRLKQLADFWNEIQEFFDRDVAVTTTSTT